MRHLAIIALALLAGGIFAESALFDPDSVEDIKGQKRYSYFTDSLETDSLLLATHYTQAGRGDTLFAFENSAGEDTIFTLISTMGETLNVGKVDTVYGEGPGWSNRAWIVKMNGAIQEGVPKIKVVHEEWSDGFELLRDVDTHYHDLGDESMYNVYYTGPGGPSWVALTVAPTLSLIHI